MLVEHFFRRGSNLKGPHGSGSSTRHLDDLEVQTGGVFYYNISAASKGECYVCNGDIYHNMRGSEWCNLGQIQGPQGEPGTPVRMVQMQCNIITTSPGAIRLTTQIILSRHHAAMVTSMPTWVPATTPRRKTLKTSCLWNWNKVKGTNGAAGKDAINIQIQIQASIVHKKVSIHRHVIAVDVQSITKQELK